MATEAEHVRPGGQSQVFQFGELAETEALGDMAAGVVADRSLGQSVGRSDPAVQSAGAFGGLGRVLGDVASDLGIGQFSGRGDGSRVEFPAPGQGARREPWPTRCCDVDGAGGLVDGGGEPGEVAQAGGAVPGPAGPSRRMMAWK